MVRKSLPWPRFGDVEPSQRTWPHQVDLPEVLGLEAALADPAPDHLHIALDALGYLLDRQIVHGG